MLTIPQSSQNLPRSDELAQQQTNSDCDQACLLAAIAANPGPVIFEDTTAFDIPEPQKAGTRSQTNDALRRSEPAAGDDDYYGGDYKNDYGYGGDYKNGYGGDHYV